MGKNIILIKYLPDVETEEQDLVLYNQFFTEEEMDNDWPSFIYENDGSRWGEGDPIKIEDLQNHLEEIKNSGASHVEIMHHEDHHCYIFTPSFIRKATEEEIKAEEDRVKEGLKMKRLERIKNMKEEIQRMEKELE